MDANRVLKLTLMENGLDFIREGVEALYAEEETSAPPPRAHKYALLHVFSGALLVLKERLRREHESLIFKDVSRSVRLPRYLRELRDFGAARTGSSLKDPAARSPSACTD